MLLLSHIQLGNFDNGNIILSPFSPSLGNMIVANLVTVAASVYPLTKRLGQVMKNTYSDESYSSCHTH